jgi:hypothetical protein
MQSNLRSLFAGKREAVELPAKRGPGRPPKVRKKEEETEQPDELVEALQSLPDHHQASDERLRLSLARGRLIACMMRRWDRVPMLWLRRLGSQCAS